MRIPKHLCDTNVLASFKSHAVISTKGNFFHLLAITTFDTYATPLRVKLRQLDDGDEHGESTPLFCDTARGTSSCDPTGSSGPNLVINLN